ncbi:cytochrome P450 81Q32 [Cryptomeria japonica]|uniref:cytochrome P450 81Q32 n=1 Tax=Cryptomeria japonica TaxID=3369 RepID=UPI0025AD7B8D|nr:cytochrome P450 81Q32 [Cryptomeria japonica]
MVQAMDITISMMSVILVGVATVFLVATILLKHNGKYRCRLPPGPRAIPVIGHFHLLMDKTKPIHQILSSLSTEYGAIMHLKFGSCPVLVISSSDLAKESFTVNDKAFASRPRSAQGQHLGYNYSMLGWAPYGPYWRNARKICVLELLSSKRIQSFGPKRMQEIKKTVNSLFQQTQLQSIVKMRRVLSKLTFKVLMTMIIDERYFGEESGISVDSVTHLIEESFMLHGVLDIGDYIPWLKWFDLQGYVKAMKTVNEKLDLYMQRIVEKHRDKRLKDGVEIDDFIDVLISQAEENGEAIPDKDAFIKATAIVLFSAGSDTSSVSLEWALSLLLQHPDVMRKAREELDSKVGRNRMVEESDIPQLTYLQAIVKETMRLHPPAPMLMPHKSIEACTVGGYHIPAGTMLMVNAWVIHRDPKLWNKPLDFIPERFMEKGMEMDNIQMKGNEFEMLPFGAGRRGCPGTTLAMCMVQTTLAILLQSFDWFVPDGKVLDMSEGVGLTTPRAVPLEVFIKPRLSHHLYQK